MKIHLNRRTVLAGLTTLVPACTTARAPETAGKPLPRPATGFPEISSILSKSRVTGATGFALMDIESGAIVEAHAPDDLFLPASVSKVPTALYALDALGSSFRFRTRLLGTAALNGGTLGGDLILQGGGDPSLDTDGLAALASTAVERGLASVKGRFLVDGSVLPSISAIDPGQPTYVSYNPSVSGLNLNFNRVYLEWKQAKGGRNISLEARAKRHSPQVSAITIDPVARRAPLFTWQNRAGVEYWTVAESALGRKGGRWLPVRNAAGYAGDVFRKMAANSGLTLPQATVGTAPGVVELVAWESAPLQELVRDTLKYSNNLMAEVLGLAATRARGGSTQSLTESGTAMTNWMREKAGLQGPVSFQNHSGLSADTKITPRQAVTMLAKTDYAELKQLMKPISLDAWGSERPLPSNARVNAKTGTLNFVRGLAGYLEGANGRTYAFAIFAGDLNARAGVIDASKERPPGSKTWRGRAKAQERALLRSWAARFTTA